ncbi:MAG: exonuclease subunit SbcD, partial [Desulfovibrio sp.]|nr:exonuclease subunit SbcD [Desulfovibrio sp.]
ACLCRFLPPCQRHALPSRSASRSARQIGRQIGNPSATAATDFPMRMLHTSDWHLGQLLCDHSRDDEHKAFLDWLAAFAGKVQADALLLAGDVFDSMAPSSLARRRFFEFLAALERTGCRQAVIIGGNHDSPSVLNAPAEYERAHGVWVAGEKPAALDEELVWLNNREGEPCALLCAVPYLRDADVRVQGLADDPRKREDELRQGVAAHYLQLAQLAQARLQEAGLDLPVLAMGHFYAMDAKRFSSETRLDRGTLGAVPVDRLAEAFDYAALGHLHSAQSVGCFKHVRYPGSPLPMSFDEQRPKEIVVLDAAEGGARFGEADLKDFSFAHEGCRLLAEGRLRMARVRIPCFRPVVEAAGTAAEAVAKVEEIFRTLPRALVKVSVQGGAADAYARIQALAEAHAGDPERPIVLQFVDEAKRERFLAREEEPCPDLASLAPRDVFRMRMADEGLEEALQARLLARFDEACEALRLDGGLEADAGADGQTAARTAARADAGGGQ